MTRTRSEYRLSPIATEPPPVKLLTREVNGTDRNALAALMLDAYRGTIDDEGEDTADALAAVDYYLAEMQQQHSFVVIESDRVVAMAFVTVVDGVHYVDPIVVASERKRTGLGRQAVRMLLNSLATAGSPRSPQPSPTATLRPKTCSLDSDSPGKGHGPDRSAGRAPSESRGSGPQQCCARRTPSPLSVTGYLSRRCG